MATRKPADRKPKRHPKSELFVYETDEARIEMPYVENLPAHVVLDLSEHADDEAAATRAMIDLLFSEQRDEFNKLTLGEFVDLQQKWNEESAISLGEL